MQTVVKGLVDGEHIIELSARIWPLRAPLSYCGKTEGQVIDLAFETCGYASELDCWSTKSIILRLHKQNVVWRIERLVTSIDRSQKS